jgi:L-alanine-DL-glutamate epimerase-like enolase superfamily enzyme
MKITAITRIEGGLPIPVPHFWPAWWPGLEMPDMPYSIVVVETDAGVSGFGPGSIATGPTRSLARSILRERVLGQDVAQALDIGALVNDPRQLPQLRHGRPLMIELPLWDLLGKLSGLAVYRLLGGYRDRVNAYCSTGSVLPVEQHVEQALDAYDRGYRAIKLRLHRPNLDDDLNVVRAVRDVLGDGMEIMADANQQQNPFWSRADALRAARALQELGVVWLEEPLPMYDAEGLAALSAAVEIPIAGAENEYRLPAYSALLERRALDLVQPDLVGCGGLLEFRKIAAVAESHQTWALPHVWDHGLTLLCSLHAIGSVPNAPYAESTDDVNWPASVRDALLASPLQVVDGEIAIPRGPGWGVDLNWEVVHRYARVEERLEA